MGLKETFYQVSEDVGAVEVCASMLSPVIDCPTAFPFGVTLRTLNSSMGKMKTKLDNCKYFTNLCISTVSNGF